MNHKNTEDQIANVSSAPTYIITAVAIILTVIVWVLAVAVIVSDSAATKGYYASLLAFIGFGGALCVGLVVLRQGIVAMIYKKYRNNKPWFKSVITLLILYAFLLVSCGLAAVLISN